MDPTRMNGMKVLRHNKQYAGSLIGRAAGLYSVLAADYREAVGSSPTRRTRRYENED